MPASIAAPSPLGRWKFPVVAAAVGFAVITAAALLKPATPTTAASVAAPVELDAPLTAEQLRALLDTMARCRGDDETSAPRKERLKAIGASPDAWNTERNRASRRDLRGLVKQCLALGK